MTVSLAPYVPSSEDVVTRMLEVAHVTRDDVVFDLGCGDGRILFAAVKNFHAKRAVGYELQDDLYDGIVDKIKAERLDRRIRLGANVGRRRADNRMLAVRLVPHRRNVDTGLLRLNNSLQLRPALMTESVANPERVLLQIHICCNPLLKVSLFVPETPLIAGIYTIPLTISNLISASLVCRSV